jgi:hypothetical protein
MKNLRFFAVLIFGGILSACTQPSFYEGAEKEWRAVCNPAGNIAVCYFAGATFQSGDVEGSRLIVTQALRDALNLPLEELRTKRYPNYQLEPNQWTFERLLDAYYTSSSGMADGDKVEASTEGFIEAVKQPEAIPALKKAIAKLEEE